MKSEKQCDPAEVQLKSFFMGPQGENSAWFQESFREVFERWIHWRSELYPDDGTVITSTNQRSDGFLARRKVFSETITELLDRFEREVPKFSPRYLGHMFSDISLPALIGHFVALIHNPNNISGESSVVGTKIERESVQFLAEMIGYPANSSIGHFTSGGTVANLEAMIRAHSRMHLWLAASAYLAEKQQKKDLNFFRASSIGWNEFDRPALTPAQLGKWLFGFNPVRDLQERLDRLANRRYDGSVILVPKNSHYSWQKGARILGISLDSIWDVELDQNGRLSIPHLSDLLWKAELESRPVMMVVSVAGTTELGGIDPVHEVQNLIEKWREKGVHIWHHVDAAYGGYFCSIDRAYSDVLSVESKAGLAAVGMADSVTLDPHKLGYVPYAAGTILVKNRRDYYFKSYENAPYIDFLASEDRGPYTLEGSRSAAGAVATWMTAKTMGMKADGYGLLLSRTIRVKKELSMRLSEEKLPLLVLPSSDTNILCFSCVTDERSFSSSNVLTSLLYRLLSTHGKGEFFVSKTTLYRGSYSQLLASVAKEWKVKDDEDQLLVIRMSMMNPFFGSMESEFNYQDGFIDCLKRYFAELKKVYDSK
jgi:glutamate/tyrosine decarboxylase-like PLP-dependent enzyme